MEKKQGRGFVSLVYGFDARWLLQQRDGDRQAGSPEKGNQTSRQVGRAVWINSRPAL